MWVVFNVNYIYYVLQTILKIFVDKIILAISEHSIKEYGKYV